MGLQRVGVLCVALGLAVAVLTAVLVGPAAGGTEAACLNHDPSYALEGVDVDSLTISYTDGCNDFTLQPFITGGVGLTGVGALVGLLGIGRARGNRS